LQLQSYVGYCRYGLDDRDKRQVDYIDTIDDQECYEKCQLTSSCTAFAYAYSITGKDCYLYGSGPYTRGNGFAYTTCYIMPPLGTYHQRYRNIHPKKLKNSTFLFYEIILRLCTVFHPKTAYLGSRFSNVPECQTKENHKCKFPFEYNGKRHFECTTDGGEDEPWCYQITGGWGYCKTETCKSSGNLTKQFQSLYSIIVYS